LTARPLALLGALALTVAAAPEPPRPDAGALVRAAEAGLRAGSVRLEGVLWPRGERGRKPEKLAFRAWLDGAAGRGRLELTAPSRQAGRTWLYLPPVLWGVQPESGPPRRLAPEVLEEGWMRGQLALGELLVGLGNPDDWRYQLLREEELQVADATLRAYVVESQPRDASQERRGRALHWVEEERGLLLRRDRLDAEGSLRRRIEFEDFREVGGRFVAHRWIASAPDGDGPATVLELRVVEPEATFDAGVFAAETLLEKAARPRD
jgi:hypothetical protein